MSEYTLRYANDLYDIVMVITMNVIIYHSTYILHVLTYNFTLFNYIYIYIYIYIYMIYNYKYDYMMFAERAVFYNGFASLHFSLLYSWGRSEREHRKEQVLVNLFYVYSYGEH